MTAALLPSRGIATNSDCSEQLIQRESFIDDGELKMGEAQKSSAAPPAAVERDQVNRSESVIE